jgi:septal ring factor EnvC (AmiA/AmiB activator)
MNTEYESQSEGKKYKSPKHKLIRFFENSRDKWKKKARDAKYQIKLLRKKVKYLEQNKRNHKEHSSNLEHQILQMKNKEKEMQAEIDRLKKNL